MATALCCPATIVRILIISPSQPDYLAVTLLHGLRSLSGIEVIDYPRYDVAYSDFPMAERAAIYGRGFTAFFGCEAVECKRTQIDERVANGEFDLIIFAAIWSSWPWFVAKAHALREQQVIVLDGADTPQVYPFAGLWWRHPNRWFLPRAHREFLYFKREWTADSQFNLWHRLVPRRWRGLLPQHRNLRRIALSIPEEKIVRALPPKNKDFPVHIVDPEVAKNVPGGSIPYAFTAESEYYADLRASRFGITTKRAGWDCLRHYEIAANGCVPCFRDLQLKPESCAPHGLAPNLNCLSYRSWSHLQDQISHLSESGYGRLAMNAISWARANSSRNRALEVLGTWERWSKRIGCAKSGGASA